MYIKFSTYSKVGVCKTQHHFFLFHFSRYSYYSHDSNYMLICLWHQAKLASLFPLYCQKSHHFSWTKKKCFRDKSEWRRVLTDTRKKCEIMNLNEYLLNWSFLPDWVKWVTVSRVSPAILFIIKPETGYSSPLHVSPSGLPLVFIPMSFQVCQYD